MLCVRSEPASSGGLIWCRVKTCGGINTWSHISFCSDPKSFTDRSSEITFQLSGLKSEFICSSDLEVTSTVGCFCSVMLTADWSWRGNTLLHEHNVTERRGEEEEREPEC